MAKVAICGDPHMGVRSNSLVMLHSQLSFFYNEFIPYLKENHITDVIFLGDLFDNRFSLDNRIKDVVIKLIEDLSFADLYFITGNHDLYYSNSDTVSSLTVFKKFEHVTVIDKPVVLHINGSKMFMVPWVIDNTIFLQELEMLEKNVSYCVGHFDISGFEMQKNHPSVSGLPRSIFLKRFALTLSGHFHLRNIKQSDGSEIVYVGSPYQMTRNDAGDERGFLVLNCENGSYEYNFVDNKTCIRYVELTYPEPVREDLVKNNIVDVLIDYSDKFNVTELTKYKEMIESFHPAELGEMKPINKVTVDSAAQISAQSFKSAIDLMSSYVNEICEFSDKDKSKVLELLNGIYEKVKE